MNPEKEVSKEEFKKLYFQYATPNSGWTEDYWNKLIEPETGKRYFFTAPDSPQHNRLFISNSKTDRRMFFMTEESEESFFDPHDHSTSN